MFARWGTVAVQGRPPLPRHSPGIDLETSVAFYAHVLEAPGRRVSPERHYFDCGPTILALVSPPGATVRANYDHA